MQRNICMTEQHWIHSHLINLIKLYKYEESYVNLSCWVRVVIFHWLLARFKDGVHGLTVWHFSTEFLVRICLIKTYWITPYSCVLLFLIKFVLVCESISDIENLISMKQIRIGFSLQVNGQLGHLMKQFKKKNDVITCICFIVSCKFSLSWLNLTVYSKR